VTAPVGRHPNAELIARFYAAFGRRDAAAMNICYHPAATFSDPVFPDLDHAGVTAMWRMLCERGKDLQVTATGIEGDGERGRAHWDATYTFTGSGRRVLNRIDATFTFRDGLIVRHVDRFDLARWMRQAFGLRGLLIGWLPPVQRAVRAQGAKALARYRRTG
jgi:ketosteroid isomerase-like protein